MQGASFTSARDEITEDQLARTPVARIGFKAEVKRLGMLVRRVTVCSCYSHYSRRAGWP
jgi:hypothetical protein